MTWFSSKGLRSHADVLFHNLPYLSAPRCRSRFSLLGLLTADKKALSEVWRSFGVHVKVRGKGLTKHAELTMLIDHWGIRRINYYGGSWTEKEVLKDMAALAKEGKRGINDHHILAKTMTPHKKALLSEYFTVGWNVIEGIVAIAAGVVASSIALVGFGLDSYIEVASGLVLIWRLRKHGFRDEDEEEAAERKAILFVGATFFLLAVYVIYESGKKLYFQERPDESLVGIILAIVSLIVMPFLAFYKKKIAAEIQSRALRADALETLACSYLSLTLLLGLGANALFGWWWADPVAALTMVYFLVKEGTEAIREGRKECA